MVESHMPRPVRLYLSQETSACLSSSCAKPAFVFRLLSSRRVACHSQVSISWQSRSRVSRDASGMPRLKSDLGRVVRERCRLKNQLELSELRFRLQRQLETDSKRCAVLSDLSHETNDARCKPRFTSSQVELLTLLCGLQVSCNPRSAMQRKPNLESFESSLHSDESLAALPSIEPLELTMEIHRGRLPPPNRQLTVLLEAPRSTGGQQVAEQASLARQLADRLNSRMLLSQPAKTANMPTEEQSAPLPAATPAAATSTKRSSEFVVLRRAKLLDSPSKLSVALEQDSGSPEKSRKIRAPGAPLKYTLSISLRDRTVTKAPQPVREATVKPTRIRVGRPMPAEPKQFSATPQRQHLFRVTQHSQQAASRKADPVVRMESQEKSAFKMIESPAVFDRKKLASMLKHRFRLSPYKPAGGSPQH